MGHLLGAKVGDEIAVYTGPGRITIRRISVVFKKYLMDDCGAKWTFDGSERPKKPWRKETSRAFFATDDLRQTAARQAEIEVCSALLARLGERLRRNRLPGHRDKIAIQLLALIDGIEADDAA